MTELSINRLNFSKSELEERLFDRDAERSKLKDVYELVIEASLTIATELKVHSQINDKVAAIQCSVCHRHAVVVSGQQGVGKTALLYSLKRYAQNDGNYFCRGSFAQAQSRPYAAIVDALSELAEALIDNEAACERLKRDLSQDVRDVIASLVPIFGLVLGSTSSDTGIGRDKSMSAPIGNQSATNEPRQGPAQRRRGPQSKHTLVGAGERLDKIVYAIQTLITQLCRRNKVLILAVDDVDRGDVSSFEIIRALAASGCPGLLLLASYQEGSTGSAALTSLLDNSSTSNTSITIHRISIGNLSQNSVNMLLADAMKTDPEKIESFAEIVFKKTQGNAAFVVEFTKSLLEKELMTFNFGLMRWTWDIEGIAELPVTENVSDVFRQRLTSLSEQASLLLSICSFLGASFQIGTVTLIVTSLQESEADHPAVAKFCTKVPATAILPTCDSLLEEGLLDRRSEARLAFAHEQVQDASFLMIPREIRDELQYLAGLALVTRLSEEELDGVLFVAVTLLNNGIAMSIDLIQLSELNLKAGKKAVEMAAFSIGANYYATSIDCLKRHDSLPWKEHKALCTESYQKAAECEGQLGNYDSMQEYLDCILEHVDSPEERMQAYYTQTLSCLGRAEPMQSLATAFGALREILGTSFPVRPNTANIIIELVRTKRILKKFPTDESILQLPLMEDRTRVLGMHLLQQFMAMSWVNAPKLYPLIVFKMVQWTCLYGLCAFSAGAFSGYGQLVTGVLKDLKKGHYYGQLGLKLWEELNSLDVEKIAPEYSYCAMCSGQSASFQMPAEFVAKGLREAYCAGIANGDTCYSLLCLNLSLVLLLFCGKSLPMVEAEMQKAIPQQKYYGQVFPAFRLSVYLQFVVNLRGYHNTDPFSFSGDLLGDECDVFCDKPISYSKLLFALKLWSAYLLGNYDLAAEMSDSTDDFVAKYAIGHMVAVRHTFFNGLTCLALLSNPALHKRRKWKKRKNKCIKAMKQWVEKGNVNAKHLLMILEAQNMAVLSRKPDDILVREMFDKAIKIASKSGYLQDVALANQLAGTYLLSGNDKYWPSIYISKSFSLWSEYGAGAISRSLEASYPQFITPVVKKDATELSLRLLHQSQGGLSDSHIFSEPRHCQLTSYSFITSQSSSQERLRARSICKLSSSASKKRQSQISSWEGTA